MSGIQKAKGFGDTGKSEKVSQRSINDKTEQIRAVIADMNLTDDMFFEAVMRDKKACQDVVRILTGRYDLVVEEVITQSNLRQLLNRGVILDVAVRDSDGILYNVEMQLADNDNHVRRIRYNAACIDTNTVDAGTAFKDIPDLYMIFITKHDWLHGGEAVYHVKRIISETLEEIDNGIHEIYANMEVKDASVSGELLQYFKNTDLNANIDKFENLGDRVAYLKKEKEGVTVMSDALSKLLKEEREEARKEAREEREASAITTIATLRKFGMSDEDILSELQNIFNLTLDDARRLMQR